MSLLRALQNPIFITSIQENNMKKYQFLFVSIVFVSFVLRGLLLSLVPPSPSLDEVSIGYNAFSILKTGSDEYGNQLPLLLRAYDDYRPALYVYLVIPFVALFGLTIEAVRIPSVLLSLVTVVTVYFLFKEIFKKELKIGSIVLPNMYVALLTMLLVAISPWHIYLSRLGHEVNLGLTVTILGIYFFFRAIDSKHIFASLLFSAVFFALSFYSYQSQKVIVPFLILTLIILFWKKLFRHVKESIGAAVVGFVIVLPALIVSLSPVGLTRLDGTTVFTDNHTLHQQRLHAFVLAKEEGDILGQIVYNRRFNNLAIFFGQYISHFDPQWLFFGNVKEDHKVPYLGLLYIWELPFLLMGVFVLIKSTIDTKIKIFLFIWFFTSPLAASITTGAPHAMRSFTFIPIIQLFSALGLVYTYLHMKRFIPQFVVVSVLIIVFVGSIAFFSQQYFYTFPRFHSDSFQYPLTTALKEVIDSNEREKIVVSNEDNLTQSYMFYLFHSKHDPQKYLAEGGTGSGGFSETHTISGIEFRPIDYENEEQHIFLLGNPSDFPENARFVKEYTFISGDSGVVLVQK